MLIIRPAPIHNPAATRKSYIRGDDLETPVYRDSVKRRLLLLYSLNAADWICTVTLLRFDGFFEANPIARLFIGSLPLGFMLKLIMPMVIVACIVWLCEKLDRDGLKAVSVSVTAAVIFYLLLCACHIINFVILFFRQ